VRWQHEWWRHARATALLPGTVSVAVPAAILVFGDGLKIGWGPDGIAAGLPVLLGLALIAAGLAFWLWTARLLAWIGKGTLAPGDPTRRLVVEGPYGYLRNPMISGVLACCWARLAVFGSPALLIWCAVLLASNWAFFCCSRSPAWSAGSATSTASTSATCRAGFRGGRPPAPGR
jgi:protein-S-isoprenylcysteine O-methyltransferase Ste14